MILEYDQIYHCGKRSLTFFLIKYGWLFFLAAAGLFYLDFEMNFGSLRQPTIDFLASHEDWYISVAMLTEWTFLLALSVIFIGYIRSKVLHRRIKFKIDAHAFHLREGLFMIKETTIPYLQISNVHLVRPYAYRLIGLARLDILTVSDKDVLRRNSGKKLNDYLIPLNDTSIAKALAAHLMKHASGGRVNGIEVTNTESEQEYEEEDFSDEKEVVTDHKQFVDEDDLDEDTR
jgi:uncharacterized membrane protein YdbT with pleckstrin-like domain